MTLEIQQKAWFQGRRQLAVDDKKAVYTEKRLMRRQTISHDLHYLDPDPVVLKTAPTDWLAVAIGSALILLLCVGCALAVDDEDARAASILFAVLAALFLLVSAMRIAARKLDCTMFLNRFTGEPAVVLFTGKPDLATFKDFVVEFAKRITAATEAKKKEIGALPGGLAHEIRELVKLRDEGLLSHDEFKQAKAKLLDMEPWQLDE